MAYNKENYRRIRAKYQTKYLKAYEEAERRTAELHRISPELAAIDRELSGTGAEIALAMLGAGKEHEERLAAVQAKNLALQEKRAALLQKLGYPADYTLPPYECKLCRDSGFVGTKMCECMRRELVLAAFENSGFGNLLNEQTFETFSLNYYPIANREKMRGVLRFLREYADNFSYKSPNLIFSGDSGLGKTHLSSAVAKRVIEKGYDVYYTGAIRMFSDFEYARFGNGLQESAVDTARYIDCDLLIIDDLGTEVTNQFTISCLYMVINERINLHRPTIISTNVLDEMEERYPARMASRLAGEFEQVKFVGEDIRQQKLLKTKK